LRLIWADKAAAVIFVIAAVWLFVLSQVSRAPLYQGTSQLEILGDLADEMAAVGFRVLLPVWIALRIIDLILVRR
jgi:hypothetical protein